MKPGRAIIFGLLGAGTMSLVAALLRLAGLPIRLELILGTLIDRFGPGAFALGFAIHLVMGALFGLLYAFLFERVWDHGGAATGMILSVLHAALIGIFVGLTPQFHPLVPDVLPDPGAYFSGLGAPGVIAFFGLHLIFGAIVGAGYGHVPAEHNWAPEGRL